jgi:Protein of unknown function (DUF2946)
MKWFRSNIKHGSRLALLALAVQFVLAFGHYHGGFANAAVSIQSGVGQAEQSHADRFRPTDTIVRTAPERQPADRDSDREPGDICAICAVVALTNTVLLTMPPLLLLPQAVEFLYLTTEAGFVHRNSARAAFQPRAPPIS